MQQYLNLLSEIKNSGTWKKTRTGKKSKWISGFLFKHNMQDGFPLCTHKRVPFRWVAEELLFFLRGQRDKRILGNKGITIWDDWAHPRKAPYGTDPESKKAMRECYDLGRIYGVQWREYVGVSASWPEHRNVVHLSAVDQLHEVLKTLEKNPLDRRMIVTAWNPAELDEMALPPCHYAWQLMSDGEYLDLSWNQRSVYVPIGLPFNIASYGLLLEVIARAAGLKPRNLIGFLADCHYYEDQEEAVETILNREPQKLPSILDINLKKDADILEKVTSWEVEDVVLINYIHGGAIKIPIAV